MFAVSCWPDEHLPVLQHEWVSRCKPNSLNAAAVLVWNPPNSYTVCLPPVDSYSLPHPHRSHQHAASSPNTCHGHLSLTICGRQQQMYTITHTQTCLMIAHPVATCPPPTPRPTNQTPTHTAVSLRLVAHRAGVGHGGRDGGLWGWDDWRRAGKAQVPSVVVEALHFPFAGIWDGLTLVYVWRRDRTLSTECTC